MYNDVRRSAWDMRARVLYGGAGRRVQSSGGASGTRIYWYDEAGQVIMESMQGGSGFLNEYLYVGGQRIARVANLGPIYYYYGDHLGTARVITDGGGTKCYDADYFPWGGEQHVYVNSCAQNYKFTGKERDPDTGSDYFGARWYRNTMARFYSPDWSAVPEAVPSAVLTDPQTLNLYSYVRNNPTTVGDPDGHDAWDAILGAANAFGSDFFGGAGRQDSGNGDYKVGQAIGDFAATVVGAGETLLGGGGEVGGVALDATGVGAVAGVPVGVVSTAAVVQGSSAVLIGGAHLMQAASDAKGGGRDERKANTDRVQSAKDKVADLKQQRDTLKSKANKTPEDKANVDKLNKAINRETDRMKKSETHSRKEKGQQQ